MSFLASPTIWKQKLEAAIDDLEVRRPRLVGCLLDEDIVPDESMEPYSGADTEKPRDAPDGYVPNLLVLPEAGCGGGGRTPRRGGGGSGAASSSHSNPPPPPPPADPPMTEWCLHFYILGTPS